MKPELDNQSVHRYMRVYNYYKQLILSQQLAPGSRLPSIRRCAAELQMSRTTVETAYMVLAADGYIISRPQSGFYVTDIGRTRKTAEFQKSADQKEKKPVLYNFASASVDRETFRFELWRRYIKSALRQDERLLYFGTAGRIRSAGGSVQIFAKQPKCGLYAGTYCDRSGCSEPASYSVSVD